MCWTKMFQLWLDKQPDASWSHLIQALKESSIEMNELAVNVKGKLLLMPVESVGSASGN